MARGSQYRLFERIIDLELKMSLLTIAVMLASVVASPSVQRDTRSWYQAYEEGRLAISKNNNEAAIASLEAAKRSGPKPGRNINTYGDTFITFNPDYYLGIAFLNLKRFAEAAQAFERVRQANLIASKDRDYATFTQYLTRATNELATTPSPTPAPPATPTPSTGFTPSPSPSPSYTPAPSTSPAATPTPTPSATPTPATRPSPTPSPNSKSGPESRSGVLPPISPLEREAMTAYFTGDYRGAAAQLRTIVEGKSPTARAFFYLACAEAGLVLTGQADRQTQLDAQARFVTAGGDSDLFALDRRYISPRVLTLLGAVR